MGWQFNGSGLFVGRRGWLVACQPQDTRRNCGGGHRWVMHAMQVQVWLSLMPCDGAAASTSGQAGVGACEGGERVCVKMCKSTGLEKKKEKESGLIYLKPQKKPNLHRHRVSHACMYAWFAGVAGVVILVCGCRLWVACASGGN